MIKLSQAHVLGTIIAYLLGIFIVPLVIYYSKKKNLVDFTNERKIHHGAISRLGGVAIWVSVMLTFVFLIFLSYYPKGQGLSAIIVGGSLMFLMGLVDDLFCLNAKFKLFIQIAIATIVILLGVRIESFWLPSGNLELGFMSYPITLLWIVGITNAVNFIDGIDGLAGSIVSISALAIGIVSLVLEPACQINALMAFILMGAMCAFLTFNYNPAKIFMGDSGALYSGFLLATLSITGIVKPSLNNPTMYLPILILAIPLMDIAYSSLRRIMKGSSPFVADAEHIHHKLLHAGYSQDKLVLLLASFSMICAMLSIIFVSTKSKFIIIALSLIGVLLILNVISKFIKKK